MTTNTDPARAIQLDLDDGKYRVLYDADGGLRALRHGEPWRDLTGDKMVFNLVWRVAELEAAIAQQPAAPSDEHLIETGGYQTVIDRHSQPATSAEPPYEIDALFDALSNLEHDNYERSYSGSKNREADAGLIRAALERYATPVADQAPRPCTCHPDDRPHGPCREKYAASECQAPAAPSGEAVAWAAMSANGSRVVSISLERDEYVGHVVPLYTAPQQPAGVDDAIKRVMQKARDSLGSAGGTGTAGAWNAQLERQFCGPLIDWIEDELTAALAAQQQGGRTDG